MLRASPRPGPPHRCRGLAGKGHSQASALAQQGTRSAARCPLLRVFSRESGFSPARGCPGRRGRPARLGVPRASLQLRNGGTDGGPRQRPRGAKGTTDKLLHPDGSFLGILDARGFSSFPAFSALLGRARRHDRYPGVSAAIHASSLGKRVPGEQLWASSGRAPPPTLSG